MWLLWEEDDQMSLVEQTNKVRLKINKKDKICDGIKKALH